VSWQCEQNVALVPINWQLVPATLGLPSASSAGAGIIGSQRRSIYLTWCARAGLGWNFEVFDELESWFNDEFSYHNKIKDTNNL